MSRLIGPSDAGAKDFANQHFGTAQIAEMRAMLDDPNVPPELRNRILYGLSAMGHLTDAEIRRYAPQVGADPADVQGGGQAAGESVTNLLFAYPAAQAQREAGRVRDGQDAVRSGREALRQGGFATSDQIIDEAAKGLRLFDDFHPYFQQAGGPLAPAPTPATAAAPGGGYPHSGVDPASLRAGLDEFRGIDFAAFRADAQLLRTTAEGVEQVREHLRQAWTTNTADWAGDAKAAAQRRDDGLVKGSATLAHALGTAPETITEVVDTGVRQSVVDFANRVLDAYGDGTIAGHTPSEVANLLQARERTPGLIQQLEAEAAKVESAGEGFMGFLGDLYAVAVPVFGLPTKLGFDLSTSISADNIREEIAKYQRLLQEAEAALQRFRTEYSARAGAVHQHAATYVHAVRESYEALVEELAGALDPDPFPSAPATAPAEMGSMPAAAGVPVAAGGVPAVGANPVAAGVPAAPGAAVPPPSGPATAPGTPADAGPDAVPGAGAEAMPADEAPVPGSDPVGSGASDPERDALTVRRGDRELTLVAPDAGGRMTVVIDDGTGTRTEYHLDLDPEEPGGARSGELGVARPDALADVGRDAGERAAAPGDGADGERPGGGAERPAHRPGPDGTVRVEDGEVTITAERPAGPGGPTVVTIADGSGDPTSYVLGQDPEHVATTPGANRGGAGIGGGDGGAAGSAGVGDGADRGGAGTGNGGRVADNVERAGADSADSAGGTGGGKDGVDQATTPAAFRGADQAPSGGVAGGEGLSGPGLGSAPGGDGGADQTTVPAAFRGADQVPTGDVPGGGEGPPGPGLGSAPGGDGGAPGAGPADGGGLPALGGGGGGVPAGEAERGPNASRVGQEPLDGGIPEQGAATGAAGDRGPGRGGLLEDLLFGRGGTGNRISGSLGELPEAPAGREGGR
ncbi:hypothetical protein SAMN05421810_105393 [Amycolatopsis arida]|uniref:Proteins of 100 residues with WXG n=1 Tax=Amycolatopsis arida TaxID=587909 RepID=A0A1I5X2A9_9PSEU|nr:hypothetical protein [Amycolatopsis arida]TDX92567.1 hypothetical protein CLV69_105412 [Amycolatopsis arida]SFQ26021.1 hypothetical protein SAMN05421810_105393 [Amycolatopsis arida]